jgi:hypothetical protein
MQNIGIVLIQKLGDGGNDAFAIRAGDQQGGGIFTGAGVHFFKRTRVQSDIKRVQLG